MSSSTTDSNAVSGSGSGSSSLPKLGPSWAYRASSGGVHKGGFQPPGPQQGENRSQSRPSNARDRSGSHGSLGGGNGGSSNGGGGNSFSLLSEDEDDHHHHKGQAGKSGSPIVRNSRSDAMLKGANSLAKNGPKPLFQRSSSAGLRKAGGGGGRSLAELAANAPPSSMGGRSISSGYVRRSTTIESSEAAPQAARRPYVEDPDHPTIRYTRERLLAMRPAPSETLPTELEDIKGVVVVAKEPQDPVSFDEFDADEIWGSGRNVSRGSSIVGGSGIPGSRSASITDSRRGNAPDGGASRWMRGVALPPPGEEGSRRGGRHDADANSPEELWDDPLSPGGGGPAEAAADFSSFGVSLDHIMEGQKPSARKGDAFDLNQMSQAALKFEDELHDAGGDKSPSLVSPVGTTIKSGCGDDVNVFEDFADAYPPVEEKSDIVPVAAVVDHVPSSQSVVSDLDEKDDDVIPIASASVNGAGDSASSRLMKMIGVTSDEAPSSIPGWNVPIASSSSSQPEMMISKNPWGDPVIPQPADQWKVQREAEMLRQREEEAAALAAIEEQKRAALEEESKRKLLQQQQEDAARQAQQQQRQQLSQVEMVLMERISTILENAWGKADLVSILTALHRDDARVIPLLGNEDALRTLLMRHPTRVQLMRDPSFGVDLAVLLQTNAQFVQHQQQEEVQRQQRLLQARQAAEAEARARAIFEQQQEQHKQLKEQEEHQRKQSAAVPISTKAPWYYADPQGNIQGPFSGEEMRQWLDGGYFKEDLPISQDSGGPFHALSVYFPDWKIAFQFPDDDEAERHREEEAAAFAQEERKLEEAEAAAAAAERERAELEEQKAKKVSEERREAALRKEAATSNPADQNASSAQLKMLLGLGNKQPTRAPESKNATEEPKVEKKAKAKQSSKVHPETPQSSVAATPAPTPSLPAAAPAPVAWGGAAQSRTTRKKSMSEIQQEEKRAAARLAKERQAAGVGANVGSGGVSVGGSSGWANVAATGTGAWSGVKASSMAPKSSAPAPPPPAKVNPSVSMHGVRAKQQAQVSAAQKQVLQREAAANADDFGANMSPAMEHWCKDQLRKIAGSDDMTLASFCMTLKDDAEIRQYLTAYLGSSSQVQSFANEFVHRKNGGKGQADEWETTGKPKGRKKKNGAK